MQLAAGSYFMGFSAVWCREVQRIVAVDEIFSISGIEIAQYCGNLWNESHVMFGTKIAR